MFRPRTLAPVLAVAALTPTAAAAEVPKVVADLPAVQSLAAMVMQDIGTPDLLLDRGANAHDYQLRPSQARALQQADLVLWVGPEMTPWLDRALDGIAAQGKVVGLLATEGTHRRDFAAGAEDDHDHDHDHEAHDDHGADDGHHHDGTDPHAWLDPANARAWLAVIAADLSALDPENAPRYAANAADASNRIAALDADLAARLAPVADRPFVTFHQAYGYFADHYGLTVAGTVALGDAATPGAARLADLRQDLAAGGAVCAFPEAQHDPALVETVAEGTGVRIGAPLDPSGSTLDPGADLYPALMTGLAGALVDCLAR